MKERKQIYDQVTDLVQRLKTVMTSPRHRPDDRGARAACGRRGPPGDATHVVHRTTREWFLPCARVGKPVGKRIPRLRWADTGLCTIHSPYYLYYSSTDHLSRKATL